MPTCPKCQQDYTLQELRAIKAPAKYRVACRCGTEFEFQTEAAVPVLSPPTNHEAPIAAIPEPPARSTLMDRIRGIFHRGE